MSQKVRACDMVPGRTAALLPTVRIAQWLRYCRIMLITQKCHGMDAGARSYRAMEGE